MEKIVVPPPDGPIQKDQVKAYPLPSTIPDKFRKFFRAGRIGKEDLHVAAQGISTNPEDNAQAEVRSYVDGLLNSLRSATMREVKPDGLTQAEKTINIQALVEAGREMGISTEQLADTLQEKGLNPEDFLPQPQDESGEADEPSVDAALEESSERTPSAERLGRFSQEARFLGQRLVSTELPAHIVDNDAARGYQDMKNLKAFPDGSFGTDSQRYGKDNPFVLGVDPNGNSEIPFAVARLPMVDIVGPNNEPLRGGVRTILGISTDAQGRKFATVKCEVPDEGGKSVRTYLPTEPIPLEAILDGQVLAEADALAPLFEGDKRAAFDFYVAALKGDTNAQEAYTQAASDEQKNHPDAVLQAVGKALNVPTREDVAVYIGKERAKLPQGNTPEELAARAAGNQELDALAAEVQDTPLVTPDVLVKLVHQEMGLDGGNIEEQLKGLDGQIAAMKEALKEVIDGGDGDKVQNATRKVQLEGQLQKALQRRSQLEILSATKGDAATLDTAMRQYYDKLASGDIAPEDAEGVIRAFRSGNMSELVNAAFPAVPGETAEEFVRRMEMRAKALKVGRGAGILALIMATVAFSIVEPTQMVK